MGTDPPSRFDVRQAPMPDGVVSAVDEFLDQELGEVPRPLVEDKQTTAPPDLNGLVLQYQTIMETYGVG